MKDGIKNPVAVLDANVLYPFRIRDVLLRFAEAQLYQPCWSQQILNEWTSNLLKNKPHLKESIVSQEQVIKRVFPNALCEEFQGELSLDIKLPDEGDRHVIECAIKAKAHYIVTENLKDFPVSILAPLSFEAISADDFLASLYHSNPEKSEIALHKMRVAYRNPPMSRDVFFEEFKRVGMHKMANYMRAGKETL